jgi:saposin
VIQIQRVFFVNVMNILSSYIRQQSTENDIEQALQKVCNQMPRSLQQQCHDLMDNYGPPIIATLIREFDVSTICRKLNLCTNQMKVELSHVTKANPSSCGVCDYVSTYLDFTLKRDSSEKSLQHALTTVCTHLSSEQKSQCQTLVQLIGSNQQKFESGFGKNFCKELPICQTPMSELKPAVHHKFLPTMENEEELKELVVENLDETPQCMLCRYVVTYLDAALKNNKSEAAVEAALARVCTILPRQKRSSCNEFVTTYGPVLAQLVSELADPQLVCRYLGMCQAVSKESTPMTYSNHRYARIPV